MKITQSLRVVVQRSFGKARAGLVLGVALLVGACASPVEDVNRVQPHFVSKAQFEGEWYYRQMIVQVSPELPLGFVGLEGSLEKIRWEITEDNLLAYRTHEAVPGLDEERTRPGAEYKGDPVAAYPITAHFDIKRDYNVMTGEQSNVIGENTTDRPWYEREFIRVNWAGNAFDGPVDLSFVKSWASNSDYVRETEIDDPDHLVVTPHAIHLTTTAVISDGGRTCWLQYGVSDCGSGVARVKSSFVRADAAAPGAYHPVPYLDNVPVKDAVGRTMRYTSLPVARDAAGEWESLDFLCTPDAIAAAEARFYPEVRTLDDCREVRYPMFERFGFFRTERYRYDRRVGPGHDANREYFANLHAIWQNGQAIEPFEDVNGDGQYDPPEPFTDLNGNGLFDLGEPFEDLDGDGLWSPGEPFDDYNENGRRDEEWVPTPYRDLRPQPIVYHLNAGFPADLHAVTAEIANEWDAAFMDAARAVVGRQASEQARRHCRDRLRREYHGCLARQGVGGDCAERFAVGDNGRQSFEACAEVARAAARTEADLREELGALTRASGVADWRFLPGDTHRAEAIFQIQKNSCSAEGIAELFGAHPALEDLVTVRTEPATALERTCSALAHHSRRLAGEGVHPFVWQQIGDLRFSFVNWVHEPQPAGPLGYGPSAVDPESGRIISGNAHVYGAAIDVSARNAADIVRAMNEDLDLDALIRGQNFAEWLGGPNSVADLPFAVNASSLQARVDESGFSVEQAYGEYRQPDGKVDKSALQRQIAQRLREPHPNDPMARMMAEPSDEGRKRLDALKADPRFRARFLQGEHLGLVRALHGLDRDAPITEALADEAVDLAIDPQAFAQRQQERVRFFAENGCVYHADFMDDSIIGSALELKGLDPDEVYRRVREQIFRATMLHEIGHTVGMTHNFRGSFDALNYQDEFWEIRERLPEAEWPAAKLAEFRYSSIMDYGSRFNTDWQGLGRYDRAAIKFAYGGVTERFLDDVPVPPNLSFDILIDGYEGIPDMLGGDIANIGKRTDVGVAEIVEEWRRGLQDNARLVADGNILAQTYWMNREVPYGYCFDIYRGNLGCETWDEGATHTEAVRSAIQNFWNYYVFNNYRRGRSQNAFINGYFARQARLAGYLTYPFRFFYFYQNWDIGLRNDLYEAALVGLNFINQVMGTPLPGRHCLDRDTNTFLPMNLGAGQSECEPLDVEVGTGREYLPQVNEDYYFRFDYLGTYFDKINLLFYLNDTTTRFFRVSDIGDSRAFSIGFYRSFRRELVRLMRDMLFAWLDGESGEAYSGLVEPPGAQPRRVTPRVLADPEAFGQSHEQMTGLARVYSPITYNMIWQALVLASVFNTSTYDNQLDFVDYITIVDEGSHNDREFGEAWEVATFTHPRTGAQFKAAQTSDGASIAFELVARAHRFTEESWLPAHLALEEAPEDPELRSRFAVMDERLSEFTEVINDFRMIRSAVSYTR